MNNLVFVPLILAIVTAAFSMVMKRHPVLQRGISVVSTGLQVILAGVLMYLVQHHGILSVQAGDWASPFGITMIADMLSTIMLVVSSFLAFSVAVYSVADIDTRREKYGYHPMFHVLLMGIYGTFLTGDIFNMYVWFEVMLISSFVLLVLGNEREQIEGTVKYVVINLVSSLLLLTGVALIYGLTGTLNLAELSIVLERAESSGLVISVGMLLLLSFGVKAAAFPLFFWLPASYHTPPVAVSAFFGGLLSKVGIYIMLRVFTLLFASTPGAGFLRSVLLGMAALTMVTGVLGAVAQTEMRRLLSFHIISQIGYMIMGVGLAIGTDQPGIAVIGAIFYVVHNIVAKSNLFLISGIVKRIGGSFDLSALGGMYKHQTWLSVLFLISAFALAGFPPLSGFWAKFYVIYAGLQAGEYLLAGVALGVGVLTLFSMTKIWKYVFWSPAPENSGDIGSLPATMSTGNLFCLVLPVVLMAAALIGLGLFPEPVYEICKTAQHQTLHPELYREAVDLSKQVGQK